MSLCGRFNTQKHLDFGALKTFTAANKSLILRLTLYDKSNYSTTSSYFRPFNIEQIRYVSCNALRDCCYCYLCNLLYVCAALYATKVNASVWCANNPFVSYFDTHILLTYAPWQTSLPKLKALSGSICKISLVLLHTCILWCKKWLQYCDSASYYFTSGRRKRIYYMARIKNDSVREKISA